MKAFLKKQGFLIILTIILIGAVSFAANENAKNYLFAFVLKEGGYLFNLVDKERSLEKYAPEDLVELSELGAGGKYIRKIVYDPLSELVTDAKKDGVALQILSAYRSYDYQKNVHAYYERNYENADKFSAEAGHSEHQLGTVIDFGSKNNPATNLRQSFANTLEGKWLSENSWEYGFVITYPENAEDITGFFYEPWHFRFIGAEAAEDFQDSGLTLFEYLKQAPQYYTKESLKKKLIRLPGKPEVYYVTEAGYKRHIPSARAFYSYGNKWNEIVFIDSETFNELPDVKLIKLDGGKDIYLLDGGKKRLIESPSPLADLGYNLSEAAPVSYVELASYETGDPLTENESASPIDSQKSDIFGLDVPFTAQAPFGNWEDPRQQNGCEEAAVFMAMRWVNGKTTLDKNEALAKIIEISNYQKEKYGVFQDASAEDTVERIFKDYYNYDKVDAIYGITTEDIKNELSKENLVIVPIDGRLLQNPFYTPPGPIEHMIVIKGYDPLIDEFITNDPGTRHGESYRYKTSVVDNALRDYPTGFHAPIEKIEKAMIVVQR